MLSTVSVSFVQTILLPSLIGLDKPLSVPHNQGYASVFFTSATAMYYL